MERIDKFIYYKKLAKNNSFGDKRKLENVEYIVVHYTANNNDTAKNNVDFFALWNKRLAGSHYFVGRDGVAESIPPYFTAWSVGDKKNTANGGGAYYKKCNNSNSVSVELCDFLKWNKAVVDNAVIFISELRKYLSIDKKILYVILT